MESFYMQKNKRNNASDIYEMPIKWGVGIITMMSFEWQVAPLFFLRKSMFVFFGWLIQRPSTFSKL